MSIILVISFLLIFKIDYESYNQSAKYLSYLLTPATVSLAIPLYEKLDLLKKHFVAIIIGCILGAVIGFYAPVIPYTYSSYLAIGIVAALDTVFGGINSIINKHFDIFFVVLNIYFDVYKLYNEILIVHLFS